MSGDHSSNDTEYHLYAVTVGCPACHEVSQFIVTTEDEVGLMQDIVPEKSHCPDCGVHIDTVGAWDLRSEHEVMVVSGDRSVDTATEQEDGDE